MGWRPNFIRHPRFRHFSTVSSVCHLNKVEVLSLLGMRHALRSLLFLKYSVRQSVILSTTIVEECEEFAGQHHEMSSTAGHV